MKYGGTRTLLTPKHLLIFLAALALIPSVAAANLTVWTDYYPDDPTRTSHAKAPQAGTPVYWKLIVANTGGNPVEDVVIIDSLPSLDHSIDWIGIPPGGVPSGTVWAAVVPITASGTGGYLVVSMGGPGVSLQPGESVTLWVDTTPFIPDAGPMSHVIAAHAIGTNPDTGIRMSTLPFVRGFCLCGGLTMTLRIISSVGVVVRDFSPLLITRPPTRIGFSYTAAGTCPGLAVDPGAPFTPDGDCSNDILKIVFPDLLMSDGRPFDRIWWDGTNDAGMPVPDGLYSVNVESVDIMTGAPISITETVILSRPIPPSPPHPLALAGSGAATDRNMLSPGDIVKVRVAPQGGGPVAARVFSVSGRLVRTLGVGVAVGGGQFLIPWDGRAEDGKPVPRGVYIIRVSGGGLSEKLKIVVR